MPSVLEEQNEGLVRRIIRKGWQICFGILIGGLAVFLAECSHRGSAW